MEKTIFVFHHVLIFCICSSGTSRNWKNTDYSRTPQCHFACSSIKGENQVIYAFLTITNHDIAIISYSFIYVLFIFGYVFTVYTSLHNNLMHVGKESLACHEGQNCQLRRSEFFVVIFYNVFVVQISSISNKFICTSDGIATLVNFCFSFFLSYIILR